MRVTGVELVLVDPPDDRVKAYVTITLDGELVIKNAKLVRSNAGMRVSMPARKATGRCWNCAGKNHLLARFCNDCGRLLIDSQSSPLDSAGGRELYHDTVHPINNRLRQKIEQAVLTMYHQVLASKGRQPNENV